MKNIIQSLREVMASGNRLARSPLAIMALLLPFAAQAQDIFTGMIVADGEDPVLERWEALAAGAAAPSGTETIGSGDHAYRFTLLHPRTGKPAPDTDYALSASRTTDYELPFVADEKKVFQRRTDAEGRTPVFRLPVRLPAAAFDLRERFGSGPYGETFHLTDHNGNDLFNTPYVIITCTTPPHFFRGFSYPNGDTAYTASAGPTDIQLRILSAIDEPLPSSCEDGDHVVLPTKSGMDQGGDDE